MHSVRCRYSRGSGIITPADWITIARRVVLTATPIPPIRPAPGGIPLRVPEPMWS